MRIALNHTRFGLGGGVEGYLRRLVDRLLARGDEVWCVGRKAALAQAPGLAFKRVRCLPAPQSLRILSFAYQSARILRSGSFDLTFGFGRTFGHDLHRDSNGTLAAFSSAVAGSFSRSPFYCRAVNHLERKLYNGRDLAHTIAVSDFVKRQIVSEYPIQEARISVIHNGVDTARFSPVNRPTRGAAVRRELGAGGLVALFVGNDWRRKGLACAIEGVRLAAAAPWELWVLGEEDRSDHFRRLAGAGGLSSRVRFLGRRESSPYYAAADAFVFPSLFDPLSNVVLEAMASGLPVIGSPTDGASEVILSGENGLVLSDPSDPRELAGALDRLADPAIRSVFGDRASAKAAALTWERHFERLEQVFELVLQEKSRRRAARPPVPSQEAKPPDLA